MNWLPSLIQGETSDLLEIAHTLRHPPRSFPCLSALLSSHALHAHWQGSNTYRSLQAWRGQGRLPPENGQRLSRALFVELASVSVLVFAFVVDPKSISLFSGFCNLLWRKLFLEGIYDIRYHLPLP